MFSPGATTQKWVIFSQCFTKLSSNRDFTYVFPQCSPSFNCFFKLVSSSLSRSHFFSSFLSQQPPSSQGCVFHEFVHSIHLPATTIHNLRNEDQPRNLWEKKLIKSKTGLWKRTSKQVKTFLRFAADERKPIRCVQSLFQLQEFRTWENNSFLAPGALWEMFGSTISANSSHFINCLAPPRNARQPAHP